MCYNSQHPSLFLIVQFIYVSVFDNWRFLGVFPSCFALLVVLELQVQVFHLYSCNVSCVIQFLYPEASLCGAQRWCTDCSWPLMLSAQKVTKMSMSSNRFGLSKTMWTRTLMCVQTFFGYMTFFPLKIPINRIKDQEPWVQYCELLPTLSYKPEGTFL